MKPLYRASLLAVTGLVVLWMGASGIQHTPQLPTAVPADTTTRPTLVYVYDALCGWCFGFSPVMKQVSAEYAGQFNIEVISGGLATGPQRPRIGQMRDYILGAVPRLQQMTGVTFGEPYLNGVLRGPDSLQLDSEPPARALAIVKQLKPEAALPFGHGLQQLLFVQGKTLLVPDDYLPLVRELGLDEAAFTARFNDPASAALAQTEFAQAQQLGVQGFPALLWRTPDGRVRKLTNGFVRYDELQPMLQSLLGR